MKYIIFILFIATSLFSFAGNESYVSALRGSQIQTNAVIEHADAQYAYMLANQSNWQNRFINTNVQNSLSLRLDRNFLSASTNFSAVVNVDITYKKADFTTATINNVNLTIDYNTNPNVTHVDEDVFTFEGGHDVQVKINSVSTGSADAIILESTIAVERYYVLDQSFIPSFLNYQAVGGNEWQISWPYIEGAEEYELEWAFVNNYDGNGGFLFNSSLKIDFEHNSTRINTSNNHWNISNIFEHGYLAFRIRGVGRKSDNLAVKTYTKWSSGSGLVAIMPNVIRVVPILNDVFNWSYQASYTENGKKFEAISYSDGLGMNRQSQSKNNTDKIAIVGETYYDYQGRPAVTALPTPTNNSDLIYIENFNQNINGDHYSRTDFDLDGADCDALTTGAMSTNSGAGQYYSSNNPDQTGENAFIPNAEGFPMVRVQYTPDNTGRISKMGAAGSIYQIGGNKDTKMKYGTPDQSELINLFGTNAGLANHYQKNMMVDANGQYSIAYIDMSGRTVATSLAGESPNGLENLASNTGATPTTNTIINPTVPQNFDDISTISYSKQFTATSNGDYLFNYSMTPGQLNDCSTGTLCFDCVYDLSIRVINVECPNEGAIFEYETSINNLPIDYTCGSALSFIVNPTHLTVPLTKGSYTIEKTLSVNQEAADDYVAEYLANSSCVLDYSYFYNQYVNNIDFTQCDNNGTVSENLNFCERNRAIMLQQLSPHGDYGSIELVNGSYTSTSDISVFNSNSILSGDISDITSIMINVNGVSTPMNQAPLDEVIAQWEDEWAEAFLEFHPEHCYLDFCKDNRPTHDYDAAMQATQTYSAALAAGYLNPINTSGATNNVPNNLPSNSSPDLLFGGTSLTDMQAALTSYSYIDNSGQTVISTLWGYAYYMATVGNSPSGSDFNNFNATDCHNDMMWQIFRSEYIRIKQELYNQAQHDYAANNPPCGAINQCIGAHYDHSLTNPSLTCSNTYADATVVFYDLTKHPYYGMNGEDASNAINNEYNTNLTTNCNAACESYADDWMNQLSGCDYGFLSANDIQNMRNELIELCQLGCDSEHPLGASTLPNSFPNDPTRPTTTANGNSSFEEILQHYLGNNYQKDLCNHLLLSNPPPYETENHLLSTNTIDECACDKVLTIKERFASQPLPAGVTTEAELFVYTYGTGISNIKGLMCECEKAWLDDSNNSIPYTEGATWSSISTGSLASSTTTIPAMLGCPKCIECEEFILAYKTLTEDFDPTSQGFSTIIENYMNSQFGVIHNGFDYEEFKTQCEAYNGANPIPDCNINTTGVDYQAFLNHLLQAGSLYSATALDITTNPFYTNSILPSVFNYPSTSNFTTIVNTNNITLRISDGASEPCNVVLMDPSSQLDFTTITIIGFSNLIPNDTDCQKELGYKGLITATLENTDGTTSEVELDFLTSCLQIANCSCDAPTLCSGITELTPEDNPCVEFLLQTAADNAQVAYDEYLEQTEAEIRAAYLQECMLAAVNTEELTYTHPNYEYHTTLFHYDQAGNLVRTVPPRGEEEANFDVMTVSNVLTDPMNVPANTYATDYRYNSFNQLVTQTTPDAGTSHFWYDKVGRIVASQNAKQAVENYYSYSKYDTYGRVIEAGQLKQTSSPNGITDDDVALANWMNSAADYFEITKSFYDRVLHPSISSQFETGLQQNLRLRIATVAYYENYAANNLMYSHATHYSYDLHGNVIETIQDNPELKFMEQDLKSTQYDFELISGNVKAVHYQKGKNDAYTHKYTYDADNRLDKVFTSENGTTWDQDAHYHYYKHGPLARTEIGDWNVQGIDYAYTINGWLKAINGNVLSQTSEMGNDGTNTDYNSNYANIHKDFSKDVFGFSLGYFNGDYNAIATSKQGFYTTLDNISTTGYNDNLGNSLYNGNIRHMATALLDQNETPINNLAAFYSYDQLNRIKGMNAYVGTDYASASSMNNPYKTTYTYDPNGNLEFLTRNDHNGVLMDDFTYNYSTTAINNQLNNVVDAGVNGLGHGDIQSGQLLDNYKYTKIGELESDVQEGIERIEWRWSDSKISKIIRHNNGIHNQVEYKYDAFGNRVLKLSKPINNGTISTPENWSYTYYMRDASGNVMAIYRREDNDSQTTSKFIQNEVLLYGSSRLGLLETNKAIAIIENSNVFLVPLSDKNRTLGKKKFEMTNHLGNVLSVVSDRKLVLNNAWVVDVQSYSDYYPFGMQMPNRNGGQNDYRYQSLSGMERDDEVKGNNNHLDFGARAYDNRLGRWFSTDALTADYVPFSPYNFALNNPLIYKDADGNIVIGSDGKEVTYSRNTDGTIKWSANATKDVEMLGNVLLDVPRGTELWNEMQNSSRNIHIHITETHPKDEITKEAEEDRIIDNYLKSDEAFAEYINGDQFEKVLAQKSLQSIIEEMDVVKKHDDDVVYEKGDSWKETHILISFPLIFDYLETVVLTNAPKDKSREIQEKFVLAKIGGEEAAHSVQPYMDQDQPIYTLRIHEVEAKKIATKIGKQTTKKQNKISKNKKKQSRKKNQPKFK